MVKTGIASGKIQEDLAVLPRLEAEDIAAAVVYVLGTPPRVQVC